MAHVWTQATQLRGSTSNAFVTGRLASVPPAVGTFTFLDSNSLAGATALTLLPDLCKTRDKCTRPPHFNQVISRQQEEKSPGVLRETDLHICYQVPKPTLSTCAHKNRHIPPNSSAFSFRFFKVTVIFCSQRVGKSSNARLKWKRQNVKTSQWLTEMKHFPYFLAILEQCRHNLTGFSF